MQHAPVAPSLGKQVAPAQRLKPPSALRVVAFVVFVIVVLHPCGGLRADALATLRDAAVPSLPQNPQNKFCGFVRFPLPVCPPFGRIPSFPPSPGRMMAQLRPGLFYFVCLLSLCVPSWAVFRRWLLPSSFPVSFSPLGRRKARSWFAGFPP